MQGKILFLPLHRFSKAIGLSHGVMVALQFLVLSVEVRILVRQLNNPERGMSILASLFYFVAFSRIDSLSDKSLGKNEVVLTLAMKYIFSAPEVYLLWYSQYNCGDNLAMCFLSTLLFIFYTFVEILI